MPWQMAPPMIIICGAFALTGLALPLVDYVAYGRKRRVQIDEFVFSLDQRDKDIKIKNIEIQKAIDKAAKDALKAGDSKGH